MRRFALRHILVFVFLLPLFFTVTLVAYLYYESGRKTTLDMINEVVKRTENQVNQHLNAYFLAPFRLNQTHATLFQNHFFDGFDKPSVPPIIPYFLWQQIKVLPTISWFVFGYEADGAFFGVCRNRKPDQPFEFAVAHSKIGFKAEYYALDDQGRKAALNERVVNKPFDARTRPWYQKAAHGTEVQWSDIYFSWSTQKPIIAGSIPVYGKEPPKTFLGVVGVEFYLDEITSFLKKLSISPNGHVVILEKGEKDILLVADSAGDPTLSPTAQKDGTYPRVRLNDGVGKIMPIIASQLSFQQLTALNRSSTPLEMRFRAEEMQYFLRARYYAPPLGKGVEWVLITLVPEDDFLGTLKKNNTFVFSLSLVIMALMVLIILWLAKRMAAPIERLHHAVLTLTQGHWMEESLPPSIVKELLELGYAFQKMAFALRESHLQLQVLNSSYYRFVPANFLKLLGKNSIVDIKLGDQTECEMTILFCDIRGFTNLSERMSAKDTFNFINQYLGQMEPVISRHQGFIDKYIGDAIMALFVNHADDAVQCAIDMLRKLEEESVREVLTSHLNIGFGLNTDKIMLGTIGGSARMDSTVIGDGVNIASRIESLNKTYGCQLLISENSYYALKDPLSFHIRLIDCTKLRGKNRKILVFEVFDADPAPLCEAKQQHLKSFTDAVALFHMGFLAEAEQLFSTCASEDKLVQFYLHRIKTFSETDKVSYHHEVMVQFAQWSEDLTTGLSTVDLQHKMLFEQLIKLAAHVSPHADNLHGIDAILQFLQNYVEEHFAEEELQMKKADYPYQVEHVRAHQTLRGELQKFQANVHLDSSSPLFLIFNVQHILSSWFVSHIRTMDKPFADFLHKQ